MDRRPDRSRNSRYIGAEFSGAGEIDFSQAWSRFCDRKSAGLLDASFGFFADTIKIFLIQPSKRAWREIRQNNSRPNLDGLKNTRKHRPDYQILLFMGLIMMMSLIVMFALSPQRANFLNKTYGGSYSDNHFFIRQLTYVAVGLGVFFAMNRFPIDKLYKKSGHILLVGYIACLLLAIFGFAKIPLAKCELGACRWYNFGMLSVQPSEFLKVGLLMALAVFLGAKASAGKINSFKETILPAGILVLLMMIFVAGFQKDLGTAISALAIVGFQFFVAGLSWQNIRRAGVLMLVVIGLFIAVAPHRLARISTFAQEDCSHLSSEEARNDYHICHAKIAIGSGGLTGVGIGNSIQATGYLPEIINDSIFAVLGEMFGFVGLIVILAMFCALIYRLLRVSLYMENPASRIFVAGVCGWFTIHTLTNVMAMVGLVPLTGITMPLLSYGGTSLIFMSAILGITFNISSYTSFIPISDFKEVGNEDLSGRRRLGRSRSSSRSSF